MKLRMRSYGLASRDSMVFVELKKKRDRVSFKRRVGMSAKDAVRCDDHNILRGARTQIVNEIDYVKSHYRGLAPPMFVSYDRTAYSATDDPGFRVTFDEKIVWRDEGLCLTSGAYGERLMDDEMVMMEVKTCFAVPLWLAAVLTENRILKTPFSKCANAHRAATNRNVRGHISA